MTLSQQVLSVGIDASKHKVDIAFLFSDRTYAGTTFLNTAEGIGQLLEALHERCVAPTVPCVIESTGDCHLLAALLITEAGFTMHVINPLITKRYQHSSIRDAKTDTIDAKRLAEIGILETGLVKFAAEPSEVLVKKVISYLGTLEKARQRLAASKKQLEEARTVLGDMVDLAGTDAALKALDQQIDTARKFIRDHVANQSELAELAKTKGVSAEQIAILFGAFGRVPFTHRDQLVAFTGLDVRVRQSGMWQGKGKLSKRGNPYVRKVLYQIAWGLKQHNEKYKAYYLRLKEEQKKHYTICLIAIARKYLRFLYAYHWQGKTYPQLSV